MKKHFWKLVKIFVPLIAAIILLFPSYTAFQLEDRYESALARADKPEVSPADSMIIMEKFNKQYGQELDDAKSKQLKLGLDLLGGMYVTLEVDVAKLIEEKAENEQVDELFRQVIEKTKKDAQTSDETILSIFLENFDKIARPKGKTLISYFDIGDLQDISEEKIIEDIENDINSAIDQAQEVIRQRIDTYGVAEPNIQKQGARRIMLELPGVKNEDQMRKLLQTTARLEFKLVRNNEKIVRAFYKIDKALAEQTKRRMKRGETQPEPEPATVDTTAPVQPDTTEVAQAESDSTAAANDSAKADTTAKKAAQEADTSDPYSGMSEEKAREQYAVDHQFTRMFATYFVPGENQQPVPVNYVRDVFPEGKYFFRIMKDSINKFRAILNRPEIRPLIPFDMQVTISAKPDPFMKKREDIEIFDIYALKKEYELTGDVITDAMASFDQTTNAPIVLMQMNAEGAERWSRITYENIKKQIAIVLDDRVYSAPVVQNRIPSGNSQITGMNSVQEARLLEIVLQAGALQAPVRIIEERVVGPSLGEDSINSGLTASGIAFLLVIAFMIIYYNKGGFVADFAVLLNVMLVLSILAALGGTLTLPGIAGIILTIGMAVDANVLIFERIREELYKGRSLRSAIDEGFNKALSAILDSNITTGITATILYSTGTGPIQGFALTLLIGIGGTLFTGIIVSRAIIELFVSSGADSFSFGQPKLLES